MCLWLTGTSCCVYLLRSPVADFLLCSPTLVGAVSLGLAASLGRVQGGELWEGGGNVARLCDSAFSLAMAVARTQLSHFCKNTLSVPWSLSLSPGSAAIVHADHSGRNVLCYRVHIST